MATMVSNLKSETCCVTRLGISVSGIKPFQAKNDHGVGWSGEENQAATCLMTSNRGNATMRQL